MEQYPHHSCRQAVGLVILARLVFGSPDHGQRSPHRPHGQHHLGHVHPVHHHCPGGGWEHCGDWWKKEGRQAFEAYVERVKAENQPKDEA